MRLKDDEVRVLRGLDQGGVFQSVASGTWPVPEVTVLDIPDVTFARFNAILRTFRYHGFVDEESNLTKRGRHVAAKLPPASTAEPLEEITEFEEWD